MAVISNRDGSVTIRRAGREITLKPEEISSGKADPQGLGQEKAAELRSGIEISLRPSGKLSFRLPAAGERRAPPRLVLSEADRDALASK